MFKLKLLRVKLGLLALLVIFFLATSYFRNYLDPLSFCSIKINGALNGNKNSIKNAIHKIKKEDNANYKIVCKYVDTIDESHCIAKDPTAEKENVYQPFCYIRGSKIIQISPNREKRESTTILQSEMISKYASYSKNFWESMRP